MFITKQTYVFILLYEQSTLHNVRISSSRLSGTDCLHGEKVSRFAGIPLAQNGIPVNRDGMKNVPAPYKRKTQNERKEW